MCLIADFVFACLVLVVFLIQASFCRQVQRTKTAKVTAEDHKLGDSLLSNLGSVPVNSTLSSEREVVVRGNRIGMDNKPPLRWVIENKVVHVPRYGSERRSVSLRILTAFDL